MTVLPTPRRRISPIPHPTLSPTPRPTHQKVYRPTPGMRPAQALDSGSHVRAGWFLPAGGSIPPAATSRLAGLNPAVREGHWPNAWYDKLTHRVSVQAPRPQMAPTAKYPCGIVKALTRQRPRVHAGPPPRLGDIPREPAGTAYQLARVARPKGYTPRPGVEVAFVPGGAAAMTSGRTYPRTRSWASPS